MKFALVTGSSGLIGSQSVKFLVEKGYDVIGIDNDMRSYFFGEAASTEKNRISMKAAYVDSFQSLNIDIRDYSSLQEVFKLYSFDIIIHTAAQPSHDWAAKEPLTDFSVNAMGTMNLLELTRLYSPSASFIFTSTNKVYGDRPNFSYYMKEGITSPGFYTAEKMSSGKIDSLIVTEELETRYESYNRATGELIEIDESMSIDKCKHSIFGASKVAADVMVQEYGKYFGMNTVVFRGGCLTGPNHSGAELHGFLSYLIKCVVHKEPYTIFGYKGKQVRDNIHSYDLVNMFWHYHQNPKSGEVYNAGGGRTNSTSILEAIDNINEVLREIDGREAWANYTVVENSRNGDHIWYISDLSKFRNHYPEWQITISLKEIIKDIIKQELKNEF